MNTGRAPADARARRLPPPGGRAPRAAALAGTAAPAPRAVFFRLKDIARGGEADVHRAEGATAVFTVDAVDAVDAFKKAPERHRDSDAVVFAHLTGKTQASTRYLHSRTWRQHSVEAAA